MQSISQTSLSTQSLMNHSLPSLESPQNERNSMTIVPINDQISSLEVHMQRKISGVELFTRSTLALTIGLIPFIGSKAGELVVKGCAFAANTVRLCMSKLGMAGFLLEIPVRALIGIPALIGGVFLLGGALLFSGSQMLAWGKDLVEHPQEEKVNTKLARYGAGEKPFQDLKSLVKTFFYPFESWFSISRNLRLWQEFEAT